MGWWNVGRRDAGLKRRRKKRSPEEEAMLDSFRNHEDHLHCAACHVPWWACAWARSGDLQIHHLIGGSGRKHEWCNLLMLCPEDHMSITVGRQIRQALDGTIYVAEGLTVYHCLRIKRDEYREEWDGARLLELAGRKGWPEGIEDDLPECFREERERWKGVVMC